MTFIWATRGRSWGFRFLRSGPADPLSEYDRAFSSASDAPELCYRSGDLLALRFVDPLGRADRSGRVIPHEFVVRPPLGDGITTVEDGIAVLWPLVQEEFAAVWDQEIPPPRAY